MLENVLIVVELLNDMRDEILIGEIGIIRRFTQLRCPTLELSEVILG